MKTKVQLIVAMTPERVIGIEQQLPWHLPDDLAWFKEKTLNKSIVMGRKTFAALGHLLPNRRNIILTRQLDFVCEKATIAHAKEAVLALCENAAELWVIGGAKVYAEFLPVADLIVRTIVDAKIKGDAFFPEINEEEWEKIFIQKHNKDLKHFYPFEFQILQRIKN